MATFYSIIWSHWPQYNPTFVILFFNSISEISLPGGPGEPRVQDVPAGDVGPDVRQHQAHLPVPRRVRPTPGKISKYLLIATYS